MSRVEASENCVPGMWSALLGKSQAVDTALLQHVSPLGWEHVGLTGDYLWHSDKRVAKGGFRTLRPPGARPGSP